MQYRSKARKKPRRSAPTPTGRHHHRSPGLPKREDPWRARRSPANLCRSLQPGPRFYQFYRTLQAYRKTLGSNTTLVIDADSTLPNSSLATIK